MDLRIRLARPGELAGIAEIERAAGSLFDPWRDRLGFHDDEPTDLEDLEEARDRGDLFVATGDDDRPRGFSLLTEVDGNGHLHELDVHPDHGRGGIGRALVEHAADVLRRRGHTAMTLTTFRDVPWNRPFYERAGFRVVTQYGPGMLEVLARERASGLDPATRCVMRRALGGS